MGKKFILIALIAVDALLLHIIGGYIYRALTAPKLIGVHNAHFIGYYFLVIPFAIAFVIFMAITCVYTHKSLKKHRDIGKNENNSLSA